MSFDHIFKRVFRSDAFRLHLIFRWIVFLMCWGEIRWGQGQRFLVLWPVDEVSRRFGIYYFLKLSVCDSPLKFNDFLMRNLWFLVVKKLKLFEMAKTGSLDSHFPMVWISWRKRPTSWLPAKRDTRWELNLYEKGFCIFRYMIDEYIWLVIYWHMRQWKRVFYTDSSMLRHTDIAYDMICKTIHLINGRSSCDILMI